MREALPERVAVIPIHWRPRMATGYIYANFGEYARAAARAVESMRRPVLYHRVMPFSVRYAGVRPDNAVAMLTGPVGGNLLPLGMVVTQADALPYVVAKSVEQARLILPTRLRRFYESADRIIVSSTAMGDRFPPALRREAVRITEGVNTSDFVASEPNDGPPVILTVGRLLWWKGTRYLIRALERLRDLEWSCVVVGDGPERRSLERLAATAGVSDRTEFTGWLPAHEVRERLASCSVCCFPSFNESVGMVNIEALASGKPVVAADWGGPADIVTPECGILVPPTGPGAFTTGLAAALERLLTDEGLRERMGGVARRRAVDEYDWSVFTARLLGLYVQHGLSLASSDSEVPESHTGGPEARWNAS